MKRILAVITCIGLLCIGLCACGDISASEECVVLIRQIGDVTIESEMMITSAENAYNNLSADEQQKIGEHAEVLYQARQEFDELQKSTYETAVSLFANNEHESALTLFEKIATYSDSSNYIYSCVLAISARENFEGSWEWKNISPHEEADLLNDENDVYLNVWNPYDVYYKVDFETQTITLKFASSSTSFEKTNPFTILTPTLLMCQGFRGDETDYLYLYYGTHGADIISVTYGTSDSIIWNKVD